MLDPLAPLAPSSSPKRARPRARADPEPAAGKRSEALGEFNTAAQQVRGPAGAFLTAGEKQCASLRRWLLHQPKTPPGDSPGSLLARPLPTPHAHTVPVSHRRI